MFGWAKPFFTSSEITLKKQVVQKNDGTLCCVLQKRRIGQWSPRLAELNLQNELCLSKLEKHNTVSKKYKLGNMKKLLLGAGKNSIHAKMTFNNNGEKLYLKITGPQRAEWGKRISQCRFLEEEELKMETAKEYSIHKEAITYEEEGESEATTQCSMRSHSGYSTASTQLWHEEIEEAEEAEEFKTDVTMSSTSKATAQSPGPFTAPSDSFSTLPTAIQPVTSPIYMPVSEFLALMGEQDVENTSEEVSPLSPVATLPALLPRIPRRLPVLVPIDASEEESGDFSLVTRMGRVFEKDFLSRKDSLRLYTS